MTFFGPYQLIDVIGAGGVARVARARHAHPRYADRDFAIKLLHDDLSRNPRVVGLFRNEAYVLSMLKHPNIVETFEAGVQDDKLFIAMEYIEGRDLEQVLARCKRGGLQFPVPLALYATVEVLKALSYAHQLRGSEGKRLDLVHRDVNPSNVFLGYDGRVKVGDFGVAQLAASHWEQKGEVAGKLGYFAPEQLAGEPADHRTDLFAVGAMMYHMLCGVRLFEANSTGKMMRLNRRAKIPNPLKLNPNLSPELCAVLYKALARKPKERFGSADEMLAALEPHVQMGRDLPLAAATMMRTLFLPEYQTSLQVRAGLSGTSGEDDAQWLTGRGEVVALYTTDMVAAQAITALLCEHQYQPIVCSDLDALVGTLHDNKPTAVLVDLSQDGFSVMRVSEVLAVSPHPVPVLALSQRLNMVMARQAADLGAVDLLFKPLQRERVLVGVRAALHGDIGIAPIVASDDVETVFLGQMKVLLMSREASWARALASELAGRGCEVDISATPADAFRRTEVQSYDVLLIDAQGDLAGPKCGMFTAQYRTQFGMAIFPVVVVAQPGLTAENLALPSSRCALKDRTSDAEALLHALQDVCAARNQGRAFIRLPMHSQLEVRLGGRVFSADGLDVSRRGMMFKCEQMPPVGMRVSVSLPLPNADLPIEVTCQVVRVDLPDGDTNARIGVSFVQFATGDEIRLLRFMDRLASGGGDGDVGQESVAAGPGSALTD